MISNVLPPHSMDDVGNSWLRDSISPSQFGKIESVCRGDFSNLGDLTFGELGRPDPRSDGFVPVESPLSNAVYDVVVDGSEEQVMRIHARRVVAFVQDEKPLRHIPVVNNPRKPVGGPAFKEDVNSAVSVVLIRGPFPTVVASALSHPRPKAVKRRFLFEASGFYEGRRMRHHSRILKEPLNSVKCSLSI